MLRQHVSNQPARCDRQSHAQRADGCPRADAGAARQPERANQAQHSQARAEQRSGVNGGQQIARRAALHRPQLRQHFASRRQRAAQRGLGNDGQDQPRHQRAQIAGSRQHQQPAGAAARQNHAGAEHQAADDAAGQAAARRQLPRFGNIQQTGGNRELGGGHRGRKGQQPDRDLGTHQPLREFDHCRTQTEGRALRASTERQADQQTANGQQGAFVKTFDEGVEVQGRSSWPHIGFNYISATRLVTVFAGQCSGIDLPQPIRTNRLRSLVLLLAGGRSIARAAGVQSTFGPDLPSGVTSTDIARPRILGASRQFFMQGSGFQKCFSATSRSSS